MDSKRLGFVGVGQIGGPMASRLMDHGYELVVYDISEKALAPFRARGATIATSPKDVASQAETVAVSLPSPAVIKAVALGPEGLAGGTKIGLYIDLSTTGRIAAREVAEGLAARGITTVDCPVSGGIKGVEAGTLAMMAGASDEALERARPILATLGKIFHIGQNPGDGQMMKLVNNVLSAATMAATCEAVVVGVKAGLEPGRLIEALNAGSGRSSASMDKFPRSILNGTFHYGFATGLMMKDMKLFFEESEKLGGTMWVTNAVRSIWEYHYNQSGPDSDYSELVKHYEAWVGVECREREPAGKA